MESETATDAERVAAVNAALEAGNALAAEL